MTPASAARVTRVLTGAFTFYLVLLISAQVILYYLPRSIFSLETDQVDLLIDSMIVYGGVLLFAGYGWSLAMRARRVPPPVPRVLAFVFILGGMALSDTLVSVFFPPQLPIDEVFELHVDRGWTNRPNNRKPLTGMTMHFDENGLRKDPHEERAESTDATRILFVGDSVTLGYYHTARDAYGRQAIDLLKQRYPGANLAGLNGGTCGYDTRQECHWLNEIGLKLKPDLIVLQFCLNDVTHQFDPAFGQDISRHGEFLTITRRTCRSGIRRAISKLVMRWRFGRDLHAAAEQIERFAIEDILEEVPDAHVERAWRIVLSELKRFVDQCRSSEVALVLVCFPARAQMERSDVSRDPQERLARFAESESIPYLDLLPAFRAAFGAGADAVKASFVDSTHPTVAGHRVAGEATAAFLEASGMLSDALATGAGRD
ncbi:MAG: SGNH/GDSL hydrolase family protein [Planctomycetota bacterium]|nr:SGNH/GDSL hydrolase family protein [Planctomycetota bacterium]